MLGDSEIVNGRQGDAMNFEHEDNHEHRQSALRKPSSNG